MRVASTGGRCSLQSLRTLDTISLVLPIINIVIVLPLVLRKVPRNYFYGFRTRRTLSDDGIWYEANYLGGMNLLVASILALVARAMIMELTEPPVSQLLSMGVLLAAMIAALIYWGIQLRSL